MDRDGAGDFDRFGEFSELAMNLPVQAREVEEERERGGGGREEDVRGGAEFSGDVEGVSAEEVDEECGGGEGAEGVAEGRKGAEYGEGDSYFNHGVLREVGEVDGRKENV